MSDAIRIEGISKRFKEKNVIEEMTLAVPRGEVFALLGRNGAGKTTTIRMLLGFLRPDTGRVVILDQDPLRSALEVRRRVGYLAEDQALFGWMSVSEILAFMAPFFPGWDAGLVRDLLRRFDLSLRSRAGDLSKGETVRLGLLLALAHRPELVILDDPTQGLDPILRKEFLRDVIEHLQGSGATVLFSSHLLYEVERIADRVAILHRGRIVCQGATDVLRERVKRLLIPATARAALQDLPGLLLLEERGAMVAAVFEDAPGILSRLRGAGVPVESMELSLDEIFEAYVLGGPRNATSGVEPVLERMA